MKLPEGFPEKCPLCGASWTSPFTHLFYRHTKADLIKALLKFLGWKGTIWV